VASSNEKRDIAFKHTLDVYHVRTDRQWFEEPFGTRHVVTAPDVWASKVPYNDSVSAVSLGLAFQEVNYELTLDPFSDGLLWVAKTSPGVWPFSGPMTDWTLLETQRVKNWISPIVYGNSYSYTLRQNDGTPIPDGNWEFLFSEGLLHLDEGYTASSMGWVTPLKLTAYRYVGGYLDQLSTDRVFYTYTQPTHGFALGRCIIPVTWDGTGLRWVPAQANTINTLAKAVITNVLDTNRFELTIIGRVTHIGHGLLPNEYYFLDNAIPGGVVVDSPAASQPILWVQDANTYIIRFERPLETEGLTPDPASTDTFSATCPISCETGTWVYAAGPKIGDVYQVDTVDPSDTLKVPAIGIVINKPTTTTAVVQWRGMLRGSFLSIGIRKVCYVGLDGFTTDTPVVSPNYSQVVGSSVDTNEIVVRPTWVSPTTTVATKAEVPFIWSDFSFGFIPIVNILAGTRIESVVVLVDNPFNSGSLTVGDSVGQGRLMLAVENNLLFSDSYKAEKDILYSSDTLVSVYFLGVTPTQGSGTVIVYFSH
jgi:hypothetical protein